ncbi:MAG: DUF6036 family nucleotidyltransferase [Pseudomonadota bacterium]
MKKHEFEHTIRAAGAILGTDKLLIIGSQAIHASIDFEIPEVNRSIEVDISALDDDDGSKADLIDGSIGELSMFQETYGYYAQGVTPKTAILPSGWKARLIPFSSPQTQGITALCLEVHDLWISKAIANRKKDKEFCRALKVLKIVNKKTLQNRFNDVKTLNKKQHDLVMALINN